MLGRSFILDQSSTHWHCSSLVFHPKKSKKYKKKKTESLLENSRIPSGKLKNHFHNIHNSFGGWRQPCGDSQ
jgi:hypothetical protein